MYFISYRLLSSKHTVQILVNAALCRISFRSTLLPKTHPRFSSIQACRAPERHLMSCTYTISGYQARIQKICQRGRGCCPDNVFVCFFVINVFHKGLYEPISRSNWTRWIQLLLESIFLKPIATCDFPGVIRST